MELQIQIREKLLTNHKFYQVTAIEPNHNDCDTFLFSYDNWTYSLVDCVGDLVLFKQNDLFAELEVESYEHFMKQLATLI